MSLPFLSVLALVAASEPPVNGVSLEVPGLFWNGVEVVGERFVHSRVSVLVGLGGRFAGGGDYSVLTLGAGVGARVWLNALRFFSDLGGPLIGLRVDTAWTSIADRQLRVAKIETLTTAVSLRLGYRFVILRRVEITPEAGLAVSMGFDRAPWLVVVPRPSAVLGLTIGYLF